MNWPAFFVTLPINILLIREIYLDIQGIIIERENIKKRLNNLKGESIYLDINEFESEMLSDLKKWNSCKSNSEYIRIMIKDILNEEVA